MKKNRNGLRIQYSDELCREIRFQIAKNLIPYCDLKLLKILNKWMRVAKKSKYIRPK